MSRLAGRLLLPVPALGFQKPMFDEMLQVLNHLRRLLYGSNVIGFGRGFDDHIGAARPNVVGSVRRTESDDRNLQLVRKCSANRDKIL